MRGLIDCYSQLGTYKFLLPYDIGNCMRTCLALEPIVRSAERLTAIMALGLRTRLQGFRDLVSALPKRAHFGP